MNRLVLFFIFFLLLLVVIGARPSLAKKASVVLDQELAYTLSIVPEYQSYQISGTTADDCTFTIRDVTVEILLINLIVGARCQIQLGPDLRAEQISFRGATFKNGSSVTISHVYVSNEKDLPALVFWDHDNWMASLTVEDSTFIRRDTLQRGPVHAVSAENWCGNLNSYPFAVCLPPLDCPDPRITTPIVRLTRVTVIIDDRVDSNETTAIGDAPPHVLGIAVVKRGETAPTTSAWGLIIEESLINVSVRTTSAEMTPPQLIAVHCSDIDVPTLLRFESNTIVASVSCVVAPSPSSSLSDAAQIIIFHFHFFLRAGTGLFRAEGWQIVGNRITAAADLGRGAGPVRVGVLTIFTFTATENEKLELVRFSVKSLVVSSNNVRLVSSSGDRRNLFELNIVYGCFIEERLDFSSNTISATVHDCNYGIIRAVLNNTAFYARDNIVSFTQISSGREWEGRMMQLHQRGSSPAAMQISGNRIDWNQQGNSSFATLVDFQIRCVSSVILSDNRITLVTAAASVRLLTISGIDGSKNSSVEEGSVVIQRNVMAIRSPRAGDWWGGVIKPVRTTNYKIFYINVANIVGNISFVDNNLNVSVLDAWSGSGGNWFAYPTLRVFAIAELVSVSVGGGIIYSGNTVLVSGTVLDVVLGMTVAFKPYSLTVARGFLIENNKIENRAMGQFCGHPINYEELDSAQAGLWAGRRTCADPTAEYQKGVSHFYENYGGDVRLGNTADAGASDTYFIFNNNNVTVSHTIKPSGEFDILAFCPHGGSILGLKRIQASYNVISIFTDSLPDPDSLAFASVRYIAVLNLHCAGHNYDLVDFFMGHNVVYIERSNDLARLLVPGAIGPRPITQEESASRETPSSSPSLGLLPISQFSVVNNSVTCIGCAAISLIRERTSLDRNGFSDVNISCNTLILHTATIQQYRRKHDWIRFNQAEINLVRLASPAEHNRLIVSENLVEQRGSASWREGIQLIKFSVSFTPVSYKRIHFEHNIDRNIVETGSCDRIAFPKLGDQKSRFQKPTFCKGPESSWNYPCGENFPHNGTGDLKRERWEGFWGAK